MKMLFKAKDGGKESRVWGYWLIEAKSWFSIALLRFEDGSREAYHDHAFHAWSLVLSGLLGETVKTDTGFEPVRAHPPLTFISTPRTRFHRVTSIGRSWVLTVRGPWTDTWHEWIPRQGLRRRPLLQSFGLPMIVG